MNLITEEITAFVTDLILKLSVIYLCTFDKRLMSQEMIGNKFGD